MSTAFDFKTLPEEQQIAYYGCLFALAAADGDIDKDEAAGIFEILDTDGLSIPGKQQIHSFLLNPPAFQPMLEVLVQGPPALHYGLMVALVEIALADGAQTTEEGKLLEEACQKLGVQPNQLAAIVTFVQQVQLVRIGGVPNNLALEALKNAAAGLSAVGVPLAAVYFSGAVIGLSGAGVTSGLAALGLGFGMVPGIGTVILLGTSIFLGVSWWMNSANQQQKAQLQAERERRAQLVLQNLQEAIDLLSARLVQLQGAAQQAGANAAAVQKLTDRLKALHKLLSQRQAQTVVVA